MKDLQRQDLEAIEGGSTPGCVMGAIGIYTATQSIATQIWRCGALFSTSAECSLTGNPCR